jgi:hypothetical protein
LGILKEPVTFALSLGELYAYQLYLNKAIEKKDWGVA